MIELCIPHLSIHRSHSRLGCKLACRNVGPFPHAQGSSNLARKHGHISRAMAFSIKSTLCILTLLGASHSAHAASTVSLSPSSYSNKTIVGLTSLTRSMMFILDPSSRSPVAVQNVSDSQGGIYLLAGCYVESSDALIGSLELNYPELTSEWCANFCASYSSFSLLEGRCSP